ncbi:hypothetical protein MMYC01_206313, partial [Madurella mycetomatis]
HSLQPDAGGGGVFPPSPICSPTTNKPIARHEHIPRTFYTAPVPQLPSISSETTSAFSLPIQTPNIPPSTFQPDSLNHMSASSYGMGSSSATTGISMGSGGRHHSSLRNELYYPPALRRGMPGTPPSSGAQQPGAPVRPPRPHNMPSEMADLVTPAPASAPVSLTAGIALGRGPPPPPPLPLSPPPKRALRRPPPPPPPPLPLPSSTRLPSPPLPVWLSVAGGSGAARGARSPIPVPLPVAAPIHMREKGQGTGRFCHQRQGGRCWERLGTGREPGFGSGSGSVKGGGARRGSWGSYWSETGPGIGKGDARGGDAKGEEKRGGVPGDCDRDRVDNQWRAGMSVSPATSEDNGMMVTGKKVASAVPSVTVPGGWI